jgi:hypothetical protein
MGVRLTANTSLDKTIARLRSQQKTDFDALVRSYGELGVAVLSAATPKDTGVTAASWDFRLDQRRNSTKIIWFNTNVNGAASVALLIQFGHGTGTGGYVSGIDYINAPMRDLAKRLNADVRKVVMRNG